MLAVSGGRLIALSTPFGRRLVPCRLDGNRGMAPHQGHCSDVPRISADFLEEERRSLPTDVFAAEYFCEFCDTLESVFCHEDVHGALSDEVQPLFGPPRR